MRRLPESSVFRGPKLGKQGLPTEFRYRGIISYRVVKRSSHSSLDRTNSASSSSARISSKRRMAADWGAKSGIKTRRSTSGRVRYRRRMKPSSVAGIAPKHPRISSGLRPRRLRSRGSDLVVREFERSQTVDKYRRTGVSRRRLTFRGPKMFPPSHRRRETCRCEAFSKPKGARSTRGTKRCRTVGEF
jgi:hypothetical protein